MKNIISAGVSSTDASHQQPAEEINKSHTTRPLQDIDVINVLYLGTRSNVAGVLDGATADDETRLDVTTTTSTGEASDILSERMVECIVSDHDLSDGTGVEFLRSLRQENIEIPFLLYPNEGDEEVASKAISAGVTEYIHETTGARQWDDIVDQIVTAVKNYLSQLSTENTINRLSQAVEHSPRGIIQWDEDLRLDRINPKAIDILGGSEKELQNTSLRDVLSTVTEQNTETTVKKLLSSDQYEFRFSTPGETDNSASQYKWYNHIITEEDDSLVSAFSYLEETSRGHQTVEGIEYKTITESLSDAVYVLDEDGIFTYVNDEFVDLVGYDRDEIIGSPPSLIKSPEDVEKGKNHLGELLSDDGPETVTFEISLQRADGTTVLCKDHMGVIPYDGETFEGSVGILRDITDQRKQERLLKLSVQEAEDIISVVDSNQEFQYQSPSIERILGYSPETVIGENVWEYIHPDDLEDLKSAFNSVRSNGNHDLDNVEFRAKHANGSWKWMEANGSDQTDCPAINGYIISSRDISTRKERERQLQLFDRVLRHNLRNDLNVIRGSAETIQSKSSGETSWLASKVIETTNNLLDTASKQRKIMEILREKPNPISLNIHSSIKEVVADMEANYSHATINIDCPDDAVVTVADQFNSVMREAITNSIVHDTAEQPEVDITVKQTGNHTTIKISDDGPPIPKMERMVLSELEDQTPLYHGSGLGLWLIKTVVDRSGGRASFVEPSVPGNTLEIKILN